MDFYGDEIHGGKLKPDVLLIHGCITNFHWNYSFVATSVYNLTVYMG